MTKYENINIVSFDEDMRIFTSYLQAGDSVVDNDGGLGLTVSYFERM